MELSPQTVIHAIDLFGTASFAFSGALRVLDKRPDFVGMLILAAAAPADRSRTIARRDNKHTDPHCRSECA